MPCCITCKLSFQNLTQESEAKVKKHSPQAFTEEDQETLDNLAAKIDEHSQNVRKDSQVLPQSPFSLQSGFFVKMASRSAKDIVLASPKFIRMLETALSHYQDIAWDPSFETDPERRKKVLTGNHEDDIISFNKQMLEFVRCSVKVLETFSGNSHLLHLTRKEQKLSKRSFTAPGHMVI